LCTQLVLIYRIMCLYDNDRETINIFHSRFRTSASIWRAFKISTARRKRSSVKKSSREHASHVFTLPRVSAPLPTLSAATLRRARRNDVKTALARDNEGKLAFVRSIINAF